LTTRSLNKSKAEKQEKCMKTRISLSVCRRNLNVSIACLLSFSLFTMPFIPIASAMSRSDQASSLRRNKSSQPTAKVSVANAPVAAPAPEPFAPVITATKVDALISDDGDGKADPGTTEKIEYTVTVSNTGTTDATNVQFTDTIDPHTTLVGGSITTQPIAVNDSFSALGNVRIQVPDGVNDLLANDCDPDPLGGPCTNAGLTITTLGGDASAPFAGTSTNGGQVTATTGDGSFQYNPAPGFEGSDSFTYTVTDGTGKTDTATVNITVSGMIWFVNAAAPGGGDGRLTNPFNCLVGAGCFSAVAADDPGDAIFLFSGTYNDNAALVLLNNQKLIGAAATAGLATIAGVTVPTFSDPLPATGGASPVVTSTASGIQLASGNLLRGFTVGNTSTGAGNYDITNTTTATVGTLNISEVILNGTGGLFRADSGGTLNVAFVSATTTSAGSNGFHIAGASGSVSVGAGGAISGVLGSDVVINGGTVAFSCGSSISHAANSASVDISNHATGAVTFSSTLTATSGTGLQFNNADSTYGFGVITLNGGDAGIDILGGSGGTFTFPAGSAITSPSGTAFNVGGSSSPSVTYSGSITQNTSGQRVINIDGTSSNTITFNTGSITGGASSTGININNANGNVTFSNGMTLGTSGSRMTNQALTINGGTGTYALGAVSIFTNGAQGFVATGADGTINATGSVDATNTGAVANLAAIRIDGPVGLTTLGLNFTNVSASATAFGIQVIDTNGSLAVTGSANGTDRCGGAVTVNAVGTPAGFTAPVTGECNGGTITNITTSGVQATNATNISLSRINFANANTADGGVAGGTCDLGNVSTCNGAIDLTNVSSVTLSRININGAEEQGIVGSGVTGFSLSNSNVQNAGDEAAENGAYFIGLFGTVSVTGSRFTGSAFNNFGVINDTAGTPLNMTVTGSIFSSNSSIGGDGLVLDTRGGTNSNVHVGTSTFTANKDDHFNVVSSSNAIMNVTFDDNTLTGGHASPTGQGIALRVGGPFSGTYRFDVDGNSINGAIPTAINTGLGSSEPTGNMHGFIRNNLVGTSGVNNSGSAQGSCILAEANGLGSGGVHAAPAGTYTVSITGNTLRQCFDKGIDLLAVRDGDNNMNATVSNNNVNELDDVGLSRWAIRLETGSSLLDETGNVCADILNNTLNAVVQIDEMSVRARSIATMRFPGYTGGTTDTAALVTYLQGRNPAGGTATASVSGGSTFNNTIPAGTACTQPTAPTLPSLPLVSSVESHNSTESHPALVTNSGFESARKFDKVSTVKMAPETMAKAKAQKSEVRSNQTVAEVRTGTSELKAEKAKIRAHHATLKPRAIAAPMMAGETVGPILIGTLRPGDSVTITFQVTVNDPPNLTGVPPGTPQVENQGSVSFAESGTPVLTDDPAVGGPADKTATPVDLFNTTTTLASDLNPSNFGDLVTFTATVAESPTQASADPTGTVDFIDTSNANAVICNDVALSGGSAQCQTSALTAGTHNIRADYSGDGNFDPSQSNVVAQVVIACTPNPVVTSAADDGSVGTLREAVASVCSGSTITFNITGPGPHTITLTTGELPVTKNVTIRNDSGESITVNGNNASRVFNINSGKTANIIGLTLTGGSATDGGAILNDGTLTVVNSTLAGNAATNDGGAISTTATATSLTLINTTISGNAAAGSGGGVIVLGGTASIINSTITNNVADSDNSGAGDGGGIRAHAGTTTLKNTIVAGNFNENGASDAADDISGTVDAASSFNLIGTGGAGGLTNGVNNNQVGVATPGLGALANNGGTTSTHALLSTSTAVDAGSNANLPADTFDLDGDANTAEPLPVDQRGTGFPRTIGSSVDVGAFELGQADLSITKTDGSATEVPGTSVTYTIVVTNNGPSTVAGATVSDTFPGILTGVTFTSVAAGGATGNTAAGAGSISDTLNMPSGSSVTYTVNATIQSSATGSLTNTATVTAPASVVDPTPANNSATDIDTLSPTADLSITKTDGSATEVPGTPVTYTIVVTNNGPSDANGATVADTFPAELTGVTFTSVAAGGATGNTAAGAGNISDTLNMPSGSSVTYTVNATVSGTATGNLTNTATVTAPGGVTDPTPGNNSATDTDTLNATADLSITKTDGSATEVPGTPVTYTITVTNSGPSDVSGATVADTFPAELTGVTFTSVAAGGATGNTAAGSGNINDTVNMPSGSSITYTVNATVAASATGSLSNTATVTAPGGVTDPTPGNNSATDTDTLAPSADVSVTKTDSADPVQAGSNITYTITVTNNGPSDAQSLSLSDAVPANTTLVSVTTPAGWTRTDLVPAGGTGTLTFTRPTLAAGVSSVFTVIVNVTAGTANGTTISNTATVSSSTADPTPGNNSATETTLVQNLPNITIQDAQVVEPTSGSVNMIFTVTLSAPAPVGGTSVDYTTQDQPPAVNHAIAGQDYTASSGTVSFAVGEQFKTILVPVLSDANNSEVNETFLVNLSTPVNGIITDGTATGTILVANPAGAILISELRTSGPAGAGDDFVEIYNNSDSPHTVAATDGSSGYGLFKMGASCSATPILIGVIPNGTTIPARGHFLFTGSAYSLANYGGSGAAAGDLTLSSDIENDRNVAIFSVATVTGISTAARLDAVGFGANTGGTCDLLREGTTLVPLSGSVLEYSYFRDECGKKGNPTTFGPCPTNGLVKDSNVNGDDFIFIDTLITSTPAGQRLGAPGPQNLGSPHTTFNIAVFLLDSTKGAAGNPNRVRDGAAIGPNAANGTMSIRRRFVNNTGAPVTRLRIRVVDISTAFISGGGVADLRVLTSGNVTDTVSDPVTCLAAGFASAPCTLTILGTTLETPPAQPSGGGFNSSVTTGTVTLGSPLAPGASINLQVLLGVQTTGSFKFFFNVEALP
jgi:uncharacterized repeat protein (TIGR01451 family)